MKSNVHANDEHDSISTTSSNSVDAAILEESKELFIQEQMKILLQIEETNKRDNRNIPNNISCHKSSRSLNMSFAFDDLLSTTEDSSTHSFRDESTSKMSILMEEQQTILETINARFGAGDKSNSKKENEDIISKLSEEMNDTSLHQVSRQRCSIERNQSITTAAIEVASTAAFPTSAQSMNRFYNNETTTLISPAGIGSKSKDKVTKVNIQGTRYIYDLIERQGESVSNSKRSSVVVVICPVCQTYSKISCMNDPKSKETKPLYCVTCKSISPIDACEVVTNAHGRSSQVRRLPCP